MLSALIPSGIPADALAKCRPRLAVRLDVCVEGGRQRAVKIRLTDAEYEVPVARAIDARVSIQRYMIAAALARKPSALQAPSSVVAELAALRRLVGSLANNINQIARKLNSGGTPDASIAPALDSVTLASRRRHSALTWLTTARTCRCPVPIRRSGAVPDRSAIRTTTNDDRRGQPG